MLARTIMAVRVGWWALRNWERLSMLHFGMLRDDQCWKERTLPPDREYWRGRAESAAIYARGFDGAPFQRPNEDAL